ncbi:MAG: AAA family ATPase, partial [Gemmatimonadaceae bacterium]|nr:AAA family ATPase [Gemmatimonadaceae bacterium]
MTGTVSIERLDTGVPGLNTVLGGGLPEYSFNLIAGPPGCGKTTLAHQIMFALASPERKALYFTVLGEPAIKMLRYQQQFEFFDPAALNSHIRFINLSDDAVDGDLDRLQHRIASEVQSIGPGLVFVDSFRSVSLANGSDSTSTMRLQAFVQQLGVQMTSWQATTFLLGEYFSENDPNPVFTVADGIFWLRQSVERNSMVRKLEIMKMRGQNTQSGLHTFRISLAGLEIFPSATASVLRPAKPTIGSARLSLGVDGLDTMLDGGLPRGYSLLVAGPSGSGKSVLAASFVNEGIANGETSVIAWFEQRPNRVRNPVISSLIESGRVGVVDSFALDLSIDEVLQLLLSEIRRLSATRVVIDSLSGFELALAPTFRADFRESLSRLVFALGMEGVTVLLTSELEDRYTDLRFSPHGTAFLTDAIIVQ